ncbi:MAG: hypothetical protein ABIX01_09420 [Chitinophagaceae bacterium]
MQAYINYLLEDIAGAERPAVPVILAVDPDDDESMEKYFEGIEKWIRGDEPMHSFSYYCGLESIAFPPPEKLTALQMLQVMKAFKQLLFTWNLGCVLNENISVSKKYQLLVSLLDRETEIPTSGFITHEFCTYEPESCPFEAHCDCIEFWKDPANDVTYRPDTINPSDKEGNGLSFGEKGNAKGEEDGDDDIPF